MSNRAFVDKNIRIEEMTGMDVVTIKEFLLFVNSLVGSDDKFLIDRKIKFAEEISYVSRLTEEIKDKKRVHIIAEKDGKIIGHASIELNKYRSRHVGELAVRILNDYNAIGLDEHMASEIISLAIRKLKPKIILAEIYENDVSVINLYKKMDFKIVAKIPDQIKWRGKFIGVYIMLKYL